MGRIAAIDYGLKRIGLAISDERKMMALPIDPVRGGVQQTADALCARKQEIETIVIGLPILMNGQKGEMAIAVEKFARDLEALLQIPIVFVDERLSSKHAEASLREIPLNRKERSEKIDSVSAALLLQSYLDRIRH
jgi:putative Holliday junction resolvase